MSQKHTPGPWIPMQYADGEWGVRQDPNIPSVIVAGEGLPCGFSICNIVEQSPAEDEANAHLIAAAPDLLEALWEILHTIRTFADASDPDITIEMIYELTTNALAKAEKERI